MVVVVELEDVFDIGLLVADIDDFDFNCFIFVFRRLWVYARAYFLKLSARVTEAK